MGYGLEWTREAKEDLESLDQAVTQRIVNKLIWFADQDNPLSFAVVLQQPAIGDARFRIGDYRVVVLVNRTRKRLVVVSVGHRRDVYR